MGEFNQCKGLPMRKQANGTWTLNASVPPALTVTNVWLMAEGRSNNSINDTKIFIYLYTRDEPQQQVLLETTRAPREKITHVKISSPLAKPTLERSSSCIMGL